MRAILLYNHVINAFASIRMLSICQKNNNGKVIFFRTGNENGSDIYYDLQIILLTYIGLIHL